MDVKGQAALVTGGASGMGAAVAKALSDAGAKVTVLDLNEEGVKASAAEFGGLGLACDVSDSASAEAAVAGAREAHGPARILVNCAGIAPAKKIVGRKGTMPLDAFESVIKVNLIGTFNMLRLAAADMAELGPANDDGERGVVINTASIAAYEGQIGQTAYAASKGGVVGLTLPAARELASLGIRVATIAPGLIGTPMLLNMPQEVQDALSATVPHPHRLGLPEEFAKLALHILDNALINGETIRLDGALRMQPS